LTAAEAGATATFTVVLDNRPTENVVISLTVDDQVTAGPTSLTFTPDNWSMPQSVTVTAVDDHAAEGTHAGTVTLIAASADPEYQGITIAPVTMAIADNDTAGVAITPTGGPAAASEAGISASYTVKLTSKPTAHVTVTLTADAQVSVVPITLTFTPADWDTPQTVTVNAVNDAVAEGDHAGTVTLTAASADVGYDGLAIAPLTVEISDNDSAGIVIADSSGATSVEEGGLGDSFTVALASRPEAPITVTLASGSQLSVAPPVLTFTPDNWNLPQLVNVFAVNDRVAEGDHAGAVTYTVSGNDARYAGLAGAAVSVAIADNDTAGVLVTPSDGWTALAESGAVDTYTVALTSRPAADVVVTLSPGSQVSTSLLVLTFTPADWDVPQTVTVTALDDLVVEGGHTGAVTHTATSADAAYNGVTVPDLVAGISDNEPPDHTSPTVDIVDVAPDLRHTPAGVVSIVFSEPVTGLDLADFILTRDGVPVSLDGLPFNGGGSTFTLDLTSVTARGYFYVLRLIANSSIADTAGNPLQSDATDSWSFNPYYNELSPWDVTGDEIIAADDVLKIINFINAGNPSEVPPIGNPQGPYYDSTGDGFVAADDVLKIINYINAHPVESEAPNDLPALATGVAPADDSTQPIIANMTGSSATQPAADFSASTVPSDLINLLAADIATAHLKRRRAMS
jgi:hypothetical protein